MTMVHRQVSGVMVVVQDAQDPSKEEWDRLIEAISRFQVDAVRYLIVTQGGKPNAAQRAQLRAAGGQQLGEVRAAIVTESAAVRFVTSALAFFASGIRAFSTDQQKDALLWLNVPEVMHPRVTEVVNDLRAKFLKP